MGGKLTFQAMLLFAVASIIACARQTKPETAKQSDETITKIYADNGLQLQMNFTAGRAHNHPTFAVWIEDTDHNLIQTLFVTRSLATGYFNYADAGQGKWKREPGLSIRPAALPVWLHKREGVAGGFKMPTPEEPVPDAFTGATPKSSFNFNARTIEKLPSRFRLLVEVNQPWDWNRSWHNDRFPNNYDYRSSAQPSLIYAVDINTNDLLPEYVLNPIGHGHPTGEDGRIYPDISGHTTALDIFRQIKLIVRQ